MTIKEKLKDNDIDTVKFKDFVDEIKNELAAKGENATKITNKLTLEGEKIVDAMNLSFKNKNRRTTVSRPTTIKNSDSKVDDKNIESETNTVKPDNNSKVEKDSTKTDNSSQKSFNWSNANTSNLIINVHGTNKESKSKNASPNGRALPLSTIKE